MLFKYLRFIINYKKYMLNTCSDIMVLQNNLLYFVCLPWKSEYEKKTTKKKVKIGCF